MVPRPDSSECGGIGLKRNVFFSEWKHHRDIFHESQGVPGTIPDFIRKDNRGRAEGCSGSTGEERAYAGQNPG